MVEASIVTTTKLQGDYRAFTPGRPFLTSENFKVVAHFHCTSQLVSGAVFIIVLVSFLVDNESLQNQRNAIVPFEARENSSLDN